MIYSDLSTCESFWMESIDLAGAAINSYVLLLQITTVDEAKRFYPLFGLGANVALIFSGRTVKYFSNLRKNLGPGVDGWAVSLKGMMSIVVVMGFAICFLYWWVNNYVPLPTRSKKKKVIIFTDAVSLDIIFQLSFRKFLCLPHCFRLKMAFHLHVGTGKRGFKYRLLRIVSADMYWCFGLLILLFTYVSPIYDHTTFKTMLVN